MDGLVRTAFCVITRESAVGERNSTSVMVIWDSLMAVWAILGMAT